MKKYRLTKTWWDANGIKFEPQDINYSDNGYWITGKSIGERIDPIMMIRNSADFIEEVKPEEDLYVSDIKGTLSLNPVPNDITFGFGEERIKMRTLLKILRNINPAAFDFLVKEEQDKLLGNEDVSN